MKHKCKIFYPLFLVMVVLALLLPGSARAADLQRIVVRDTYRLKDGEILNEDLIVIAGTAILEEGSQVKGDIVLLGGSLEVNGLVDGDITATGGYVRLNATAVVKGNVTAAGADIDQDEAAQVRGEVKSEVNGPFNLTIPGPGQIPAVRVSFSPLWQAVSFLARVFILSALAVLLAMFFPAQMDRVDQAVISQPLISGGLGFFTLLVAPLVVILMAITLILIPVSLLGVLSLALLAVYGWVALGLEVGKRFGQALKREWTPPLAAGVGTFVLTFIFGSLSYVQCLGFVLVVLAVCLGLGAVLLTRLGTQSFPVTASASPGNAVTASPESRPPEPG